jgi:hypothetical protein
MFPAEIAHKNAPSHDTAIRILRDPKIAAKRKAQYFTRRAAQTGTKMDTKALTNTFS